MIYLALIASVIALAAIMVACALLSDRARRMHDEAFWRKRDPNFPAAAPVDSSVNPSTPKTDHNPTKNPQGHTPHNSNRADRTAAGFLLIGGTIKRVK